MLLISQVEILIPRSGLLRRADITFGVEGVPAQVIKTLSGCVTRGIKLPCTKGYH